MVFVYTCFCCLVDRSVCRLDPTTSTSYVPPKKKQKREEFTPGAGELDRVRYTFDWRGTACLTNWNGVRRGLQLKAEEDAGPVAEQIRRRLVQLEWVAQNATSVAFAPAAETDSAPPAAAPAADNQPPEPCCQTNGKLHCIGCMFTNAPCHHKMHLRCHVFTMLKHSIIFAHHPIMHS